MNIEKTLTEAGNYFKSKVLAGDYQITLITDCTAEILIDGKHIFKLWIGNYPKDNFDFYHGGFDDTDSFMYEYLKLSTQKERLKGWGKIRPSIEKHNKQVLKAQKIEQIKKLQKEIENIK